MKLDPQTIKKIQTLIGFSKRSRTLKYGMDNITRKANLILLSDSMSQTGIGKIQKKANEQKTKLVTLKNEQFGEFFDEGIKVVSIEEKGLANAIYQLMEEI